LFNFAVQLREDLERAKKAGEALDAVKLALEKQLDDLQVQIEREVEFETLLGLQSTVWEVLVDFCAVWRGGLERETEKKLHAQKGQQPDGAWTPQIRTNIKA
jgi:hypothetical protein